jgi:hypothetical protein
MRKSILNPNPEQPTPEESQWLDLPRIATVEISSEDDLFPIEHALGASISTGWRAAVTGPQIIRLRFDSPQEIHRIQIHIVERAAERSQEFALFAEIAGAGQQELRRQQFTFSPHGTTEELEDIAVTLAHVTSIELRIDPDRAHDPRHSAHFATLTALRIA